VNAAQRSLSKITDVEELRILPPLAIARFGSSPDPMDNYDVVVRDAEGYRALVPAPTLKVLPGQGSIADETTPQAVKFRDAMGRVRPVAPFLEVWARFEDDGDFTPLTQAHLEALGLVPAVLKWRVIAANLKASRRTGDADDAVYADTGEFSDHEPHPLLGRAENFKVGKQIAFGSVRFIRPTEQFPEIRFRFLPGSGSVYGPIENDPLTQDDVYDASKGQWEDHWDGDPSTPLATFPAQTYQGKLRPQTNRYISDGYFDDTCDGIVEVELQLNGRTLRASARFCSGVPDFAPDGFHVRTLADDLEQAILGPSVTGSPDPEVVGDMLRRTLETVRLMNTAAMNGDQGIGGVETNATNQAQHESVEFGRAFEPIFGQGRAPYYPVLAQHEFLVRSWEGGVLPIPRDLIRSYDEAGDFSDMARRKMPALMRGSDRLQLALTRRQIETLRLAAEETQTSSTAEQAMLSMIEFFRSMAPLHTHIPTETGSLSQLFSNPAALLTYLKSAEAKGPLASDEQGRALVVPGDPDASALVRLLRREDHPMHGPFSRVVPGTEKTGLQIVEDWIESLQNGDQ
jgi:hypothetical protein